MKLSSKEALALAAAELRPYVPAKVLKKETGLREHTLRYALHRLRSRGVCTTLPFINLHRLGYTIFNVFFTLGAQKRTTHEALLKTLTAMPEIVWIGEFGGEYQYGIAICTKQIGNAPELLSRLAGQFKDAFFDKAISVQYSAIVYPRRYLSPKRVNAKPLVCRFTRDQAEIDVLDRRLLETAATPGEHSNRELAQKLGIPASTVDLRMRKLEERGVIAGHFLAIDCTRYGFLPFKLLIYTKGLSAELTTGLQKFCDRHANVVYLIECLGSWDYEIGIEVQQPEEVSGVMQQIFEDFGSMVNAVKLLSKFRDFKFRWFPGS